MHALTQMVSPPGRSHQFVLLHQVSNGTCSPFVFFIINLVGFIAPGNEQLAATDAGRPILRMHEMPRL